MKKNLPLFVKLLSNIKTKREIFSNFCDLLRISETKSAQPLNEVRVAKALPEYFIKYSQSENAKRFSSKLSFDPSKPKGMSFYKIKEAF